MKASDFSLIDQLDLDPDAGTIKFNKRRMLLWDADAFGNLRNELIRSLGSEQARPLLKRFGFANGYRDALTTREMFDWDNAAEWFLSCPALQRSQGKVLANPETLLVDIEKGEFVMEVHWSDSYEAEQHVRVFGEVNEPVCWTLTGYASGFATALMGQEVYVVEEKCLACGMGHCRVVGKTRRAWEAEGVCHRAEYQACNLAHELEAREAEIAEKERLVNKQKSELSALRRHLGRDEHGIVAKSNEMREVLELSRTVASVNSTVLITGESGTGKELIAKFIHEQSERARAPFVAINCGALPEPLLESELFGHARGAFTGADTDKQGLFAAANGGTIFLDEIGETSPAIQVKLLRVLQEREVRPVGSNQSTAVDVRVIAATNRDLESMIANGDFRNDLFYRLRVIGIEIPPLRDRPGDILPLARTFMAEACRNHRLPPKRFSAEAAEKLTRYSWPGNVRELHNAIESVVVLAQSEIIEASDLPAGVDPKITMGVAQSNGVLSMADFEQQYILHVLDKFSGNRARTAKALGIGTNTLWRKLKKWGVPPGR